jgi:hypothetical protein
MPDDNRDNLAKILAGEEFQDALRLVEQTWLIRGWLILGPEYTS